MKINEAKKHAKEIVLLMLWGRCSPELEDVDSITEDTSEQELIINEIRKVLDQLSKTVQNTM